jgi:hypothetical protein
MRAGEERGIGSTSASRPISPSAPLSQKLAISARSAAATSSIDGAPVRPVAEISEVAMGGAVPLKMTAPMFMVKATPVNRTGVGKRSASIAANVPCVKHADTPISRNSSGSGRLCAAIA